MAEGQLSRWAPGGRAVPLGAAAALVVAGVVAEVSAPAASGLLTAGDFAVGCVCAAAGARLWRTSRGLALLLASTGLLWFAGTAAGGWSSGQAAVVAGVLLGYRVPLMTLAWYVPGSDPRPAVGAALLGGVAVALPLRAAGVATAALLAAGAVRALLASRSQRIDARSALFGRSWPAVALAGLWLVPALFQASGGAGAAVQLGDDVLMSLLVVAVGWPPDVTRGRGSAAAVVVELGSSDAITPLLARLRRMLADDALLVRFQTAAGGWVDDAGRPVEPPDPADPRAARVPTPGGGAVVLVHGSSAPIRADLTKAAAAASGLARERIELDAQARRQAELVAVSRRRLLETADDEGRALEAELRRGPLTTLTRVDEQLRAVPAGESQELRGILADAVEDLLRLSRGLHPGAVSGAELAPALRRLVETTPLSALFELDGDLGRLGLPQRALLWFICSECLTNVVRYARATRVKIRCEVTDVLAVTVADDGIGGASVGAGHGLRGLADRIETAGGRLDVDSPPGGPTSIVATVPVGQGSEPSPV